MMSINKMFLFCASLAAASCSSDIFVNHAGNMPADDKVAMVFKGQSKQDVLELLGSPSNIVSLDRDTWIYMSSEIKQVAFMAPKEIERDVLVIKFSEQGNVETIEKLDKQHGENVEINQEQTPDQEQEQGFFRKYFGGVGQYLPFGKGSQGMEP